MPFCVGKDLSACTAKCCTTESRSSDHWEPELPPGPNLTQESTQWVLGKGLLKEQMNGPSKESLLIPEIPRVTFHTNCNSPLGQFCIRELDVAIFSKRAACPTQSLMHILQDKIAWAAWNALHAPAHFLTVSHSPPGTFDLYFILQV